MYGGVLGVREPGVVDAVLLAVDQALLRPLLAVEHHDLVVLARGQQGFTVGAGIELSSIEGRSLSLCLCLT